MFIIFNIFCDILWGNHLKHDHCMLVLRHIFLLLRPFTFVVGAIIWFWGDFCDRSTAQPLNR